MADADGDWVTIPKRGGSDDDGDWVTIPGSPAASAPAKTAAPATPETTPEPAKSTTEKPKATAEPTAEKTEDPWAWKSPEAKPSPEVWPEEGTPQTYAGALISAGNRGIFTGTGGVMSGTGRAVEAGQRIAGSHIIDAMTKVDQGDVKGAMAPLTQIERGVLSQYIRAAPDQREALRQQEVESVSKTAARSGNLLTRTGDQISDYGREHYHVGMQHEGFGTKVAEGAGSMIAPALTGMLVPGAGPALALPMIGAQSFDGTRQEALSKGASPDDADRAAAINALAQMGIMAMPIGRVFQAAPAATATVTKALIEIGKRSGEFAMFSAAGKIADNIVAQKNYDPKRGLFDDVPEAAAIGLVTGAGMGLPGAVRNLPRRGLGIEMPKPSSSTEVGPFTGRPAEPPVAEEVAQARPLREQFENLREEMQQRWPKKPDEPEAPQEAARPGEIQERYAPGTEPREVNPGPVTEQTQAERTQPTTPESEGTTPAVQPPPPVESTPQLPAPVPPPAPRAPLETPPVIAMPGPTQPAIETVTPPTTPTEVSPGVTIDSSQGGGYGVRTRDEIADEYENLGNPGMAKAIRAGNNLGPTTPDQIEFLEQKLALFKASRPGANAPKPQETFDLSSFMSRMPHWKNWAEGASPEGLAMADRVQAAAQTLNDRMNELGATRETAGQSGQTPPEAQVLKRQFSELTGQFSRYSRAEIGFQKGQKYKWATAEALEKERSALLEDLAKIETPATVAPTNQPQARGIEQAAVPIESLGPPDQRSPTKPPEEGYIVRLSPDQMAVDPQRFQYKDSNERGVTGRLSHLNKWEPVLGSSIMAWQDLSGKIWVVDGHQRHDLATRAAAGGQQGIQMLTNLFREADGDTPEFMRVLAAYKNIENNSGTPIDAAKILKGNYSIPEGRRLPDLDMKGQMASQGAGLANLSDEGLGFAINGIVPSAYAAHVGELISNPEQQIAALRVLASREPNNTEQARMIVQDIVATGYTKAMEGRQTEMEGMGPTIQSLFLERARVLDRAIKNLSATKAVLGAAVRGEETLTAAGNQLDREGNIRGKTENEQLLDILKRSASSKGPISEALTASASELANGKPLPALVSQFLTQVRGIIRRGENEGIRSGAPDERTGTPSDSEGPEPPVEGQGGFFGQEGSRIPLYSAVERAVEGLKQAKGTGEQMLSQIMKTPGVKPEEVKWMNLAEWLKGQKSVTKEALLNYVRAHQLDVREVGYGFRNPEEKAIIEEEKNAREALENIIPERVQLTMGNMVRGDQIIVGLDRNRYSVFDLPTELREAGERYVNARWTREDMENAPDAIDNLTRYKRYTLPGPENYRELLLTLPPKMESRGPWEVFKPNDGLVVASFPTEAEARAHAALRGHGFDYGPAGEDPPETYRSSHWDPPNVLAHIRFSDRTAPDGKHVLLVEEAQSDWHQAGRKKGYKGAKPEGGMANFNEFAKERGASEFEADDVWHRMHGRTRESPTPQDVALWNDWVAYRDARLEARRKYTQAVPDAPFKTSWPSLIMKRVLKYAVDNGYDRVAWSPGEVHADRYDLSKKIERVELHEGSPRENGEFQRGTLDAYDLQGNKVLDGKQVTRDNIADAIGKDVADRLISAPLAPTRPEAAGLKVDKRVLRGVDLKVGGEGMAGFYDKILPAETQKIVGKYGVKVGKSEVAGKYEDRDLVKPDAQAGADHGPRWTRLHRRLDQVRADLDAMPIRERFDEQNLVARGLFDAVDHINTELDQLHNRMVDETMARGLQAPVHSVDISPAMRQAIQDQGLSLFQPKKVIPKEYTIKNDPSQALMPGMGPSTPQAQAARDQAQGGRGTLVAKVPQKAANEGLFAPYPPQKSLFDAPAAPPPPKAVSIWAQYQLHPDFVDETHLVPNRNGGVEGASNWVFDVGRQTGFEHLAVVDSATGQIVHAGTINDPNRVALSGTPLTQTPDTHIAVHNHPSGGAISGADLTMLAYQAIGHVVAIGHGGEFYAVRLDPRIVRSSDPAEIARLQTGLKKAFEALKPVMVEHATRQYQFGNITHDEANMVWPDLINRTLHAMGITEYISSNQLTPALTANIADTLRTLGHGQAADDIHRYTVVTHAPQGFAGLPGKPSQQVGQGLVGSPGSPGGGRSNISPAKQGTLFDVDLEAPKPIKDLVKWVNDQESYTEKRDALINFIAPLNLGPKETSNNAFNFANTIRQGQRQFGQIAQMIRDTFSLEERWQIGRALAEQSVFERKLARELDMNNLTPFERSVLESNSRTRWDGTQMGIEGLGPKGQALVASLKVIQEKLWDELKAREMVDPNAEGWAYWMPRQLVIMEPGKKARRIVKDDSILPGSSGRNKPGAIPTPDMHPFGTNMTTDVPGFRDYEEIEATLRAARAKFGPNVQLVDDIVGLVGSLERINAAIAGHDLIQSIVDYGNRVGERTALLGGSGEKGFYLPGHRSMYKVGPKFVTENGKTVVAQTPSGQPVFEKKPIWIHEDFRPALDAVFRAPTGDLMKAFMTLKAWSTHFVMQSPLIHLQVELGRAMPLVAGRQFVVAQMGAGRRARMAGDPRIDLLVKHGMAPVMRGFIGDPSALMNEFNYKSKFGRLGEEVNNARVALAKLADKGGHDAIAAIVRHPINSLLWNRVMDLQIAIGLTVAEDRIKAGWHPTAAYTVAAHLANRYAGALPPEAMSRLANNLLQMFLFSRSFTGGNLGVMKDAITGGSNHVINHIEIEAGPEAAKQARSWMRGKSQKTFAYDILLAWGFLALVQHASQALNNWANDVEPEESIVQGYVRRFHEAWHYATENPISSIMLPPLVISRLLPSADNEPGKENRSRIMPLGSSPQWLYFRTPLGKVGEEFLDWIMDPFETLSRKQSTIYKGIHESFITGKDSFGHDIVRPGHDHRIENTGRRLKHFAGAVFPIELEKDVYTALGNPGGSILGAPPTRKERILAGARVVLNLTGFGSLSRGYPYGPVAGANKLREDQIKFDAAQVMPEVARLVNTGNPKRAIQMLVKAGEDPTRANKIVNWLDPKSGNFAADRSTMLGEKRASHRGDKEQLDRNAVLRRSYGLTPKKKPATPLGIAP